MKTCKEATLELHLTLGFEIFMLALVLALVVLRLNGGIEARRDLLESEVALAADSARRAELQAGEIAKQQRCLAPTGCTGCW